MNPDPLLQFIAKQFERQFFNAPFSLINQLPQIYERVLPLFATDILAKYPESIRSPNLEVFLERIQMDACLEATFYYRIERELYLREENHPLLPYFATLMRSRTSIEIYYSTEIGSGLNIQHGTGIVIGPRYQIGKNFTIHQGVTLGQKVMQSRETEKIQIGNNVCLFAGSKVIGNLSIGDYVILGANAVLLEDAEPYSTYVGIPARKK